MATKQYWLIKSEPSVYAWADLVRDKKTTWDGVRNFQARNNLRAMAQGDGCLYYHTGDEKAVVGIAEVIKTAYPDPSAKDEDWSVVDIKPVTALPRPVALSEIKKHSTLSAMPLVKHSRLSVSPVTAAQYETLLGIAKN